MKKYLFIGNTEENTGPSNVNKGIVQNFSPSFCISHSSSKIKKYASSMFKTLFCKVVIVSGLSKVGMYTMKLAKSLGKKTIYIMHGCNEIEFELNEMAVNEKSLQYEKYFLYNADLILPVSRRYGQMIQEKYPFCKGKTVYLHNGVDKVSLNCDNIKREKGRVIAVGGDRKLKNNLTVAKAMAKLDDNKVLTVYGHLYHPDDLPKGDNIEFKGLVPQEQLYKEMMRSELYVLNSIYEPFALSVFDALLCGCSILVTNVAGALELLDVTEHDVISDPMDENEIAEKIEYLLQNPNNARLMKSLDFDKISYKAEVEKLEGFCKGLCKKGRGNVSGEKMRTVCTANSCTGCMACIGKCKKDAITIKDSLSAYNAVIDEARCVKCGACERVCPNNHKVVRYEPISWQEGWATEGIRINSSSGGAASAIMKHFVEDGGYVAACLFKNGEFIFDITNKIEDVFNFAGSKYVKSNPIGIYTKVVERLRDGDEVLFIGLPCQVAALKNYTAMMPVEKTENLYTIDLICHGTPSPQILSTALCEKGIDIKSLKNIRFRSKTNSGLALQYKIQEYKTITPIGVQDMYTYAFLTSLDYTENCYSCNYATVDRVSDVTLGDSWGSDLPDNEQGKGVSLLMCQTDKGINLVDNSGMQLKEVDIKKAIEANHQLRHPSIAPEERKTFFDNLDKGFHRAISKCAPKVYYKQKLKETLVKLKLFGGASPIEYKISFK